MIVDHQNIKNCTWGSQHWKGWEPLFYSLALVKTGFFLCMCNDFKNHFLVLVFLLLPLGLKILQISLFILMIGHRCHFFILYKNPTLLSTYCILYKLALVCTGLLYRPQGQFLLLVNGLLAIQCTCSHHNYYHSFWWSHFPWDKIHCIPRPFGPMKP